MNINEYLTEALGKYGLGEALCEKIGIMIAEMHRSSADFSADGMFRYDSGLCRSLVSQLEAEEELIGGEQLRYYGELLDCIGKLLDENSGRMIYTHADLSRSNILITDDGLVPIDFSLGGMCVPEMDLSAIFCGISDRKMRRAVLKGYGEPLDGRLLDAMFAFNVLLGIILHIRLWAKEEWFVEKSRKWKNDIFDPLLRGDSGVCIVE